MTNKECLNCIYAVNGRCSLENVHGRKGTQCPFKEGTQAAVSVL